MSASDREKVEEYFPHDLDCEGDPKITKLLRELGSRGYGVYFRIVSRLFQQHGRLPRDYATLAFMLHNTDEANFIERIVTSFDLFDASTKDEIGSKSVDRRLAHQAALRKLKREAGRASGEARRKQAATPVQHTFNVCRTRSEQGRKEGRKEGINESDAPAASDFSNYRLRIGGEFKGVCITSLTLETAEKALKTARPGALDRAALEWWINEKRGERSGRSGKGMQPAGAA